MARVVARMSGAVEVRQLKRANPNLAPPVVSIYPFTDFLCSHLTTCLIIFSYIIEVLYEFGAGYLFLLARFLFCAPLCTAYHLLILSLTI